ncbi:MAG: 5-formyltetrahydrofolate cyclo-ligase [Planctomycetota bacterium]
MTAAAADALVEAKRLLRADMRTRIAAIPQLARDFRSARACANALRAPAFAGTGLALGYRALADEVDPAGLLAALARGGWRLAFPIVTDDGALLLAEVRCDGADPARLSCWKSGGFGILEPDRDDPRVRLVRPRELDAVVVPGRAFDAHGARLGRGKGFYDGLIGSLAPHARRSTVGLAFAAQIVGRVPTGPADRPVAWIASDAGLVRAATRGSG